MFPLVWAANGALGWMKTNADQVAAAESKMAVSEPPKESGGAAEAVAKPEAEPADPSKTSANDAEKPVAGDGGDAKPAEPNAKTEAQASTESPKEKPAGNAKKDEKEQKKPQRVIPGVPAWRITLADKWRDKILPELNPTPEHEAKEAKERAERAAIYSGRNYWAQVVDRAKRQWVEHTIGFFIGTWWMIGGRMLLGMGLAKAGVFSAERSVGFYRKMVLWGYGIGMPLILIDTFGAIQNDFGFFWGIRYGSLLYTTAAIPIALGHVGLVMLIVKGGVIRRLTDRLAAVGRMALTNYLTHSVACTALFYGWGGGLFGKVDRTGLALIVLTIWIFQLIVSPIWLRHFRYGPAEWLWRSLTYWKLQPMRRDSTPPDAPTAAIA
jgi:hypothetical protein